MAPISLVPHLIGSPSHWSPSSSAPISLVPFSSVSFSLVPQLAPVHHPLHWSPISLFPHSLAAISLVPHLIGSLLIGPRIQKPHTVWTHWSPFSLVMGWVGLWGFLWWAPSANRKDHHGVSSGWSSTWFHSNTGLSSTRYEQIPIIFVVRPFWPTPFFFRPIKFWRVYG